MKKILFSLTFLGLLLSKVSGQVNSYGFTIDSLGIYTPITGGVVLGNASTDDQRFVDPASPLGGTLETGPGFPIGFNFMYNGTLCIME